MIELLVAVSILAALAGLLLPALGRSRRAAESAVCSSNARQMATALNLYINDNRMSDFLEKQVVAGEGTYWWFGFETTASAALPEGQRVLDRTGGRLWRYYRVSDSIELCPSYPLRSARYKPKFTTNWTTYGRPLNLLGRIEPGIHKAPARMHQISRPSQTLAFADSGQINNFQPPASPTNPMFEQWHYITRTGSFTLYSHRAKANASMFDGHVQVLQPEFGYSVLFPEAPLGRPPGDVYVDVN